MNVLAEDQQIISEYYTRAAQDHGHAERDAGARFDRTAHGTQCLMAPCLTWNAGCIQHRIG